eukprot:scaffold465558_cov14-Prasinocladus_malaysianus.AAC.1
MTCNMCGLYLSNGHMAGNCASMTRLRTARHSALMRLLLDKLAEEIGGRWPLADDSGRLWQPPQLGIPTKIP